MTKIEEPTSSSLLKPFRGVQLLLSVVLFHLSVCFLSIPITYMDPKFCLLLTVPSATYIWISSFSILRQRSYVPISINKVFGTCLVGIPLFIVIGLTCYAAPTTDRTFWPVKMMLLLCFVLPAVFFVEILIVLPIARKNKRIIAQNAALLKKRLTVIQGPADFLVAADEAPPPPPPPSPPAEPTKRDLTTSVSSLRLPPDADETATPDHSYRKVSFARRREYVDSPTSVPSMAAVKIAEIQTEPKRISVEASQTCKCELKEVLVQTVSRCEFCDQKMQAGAVAPSQQAAICGPPCPTVVQLLRGGIALPCCTNCSCSAGVLQIEQEKQQPKQLQFQKEGQSQPQQLQYQKEEQSEPQELQYHQPEQSEPEQIQYEEEEQSQPQHQKIAQKISQIQPEEQRMSRTYSKESDRGDCTQGLTSFTRVTVTAFCAPPNATTMEIATSNGSKENVITTYIPPQAAPSTDINGRPQIVTSSQQTDKSPAFLYSKVHRVMGRECREFESNKEEGIFATECYDIDRSTVDDEYSTPAPPPPPQAITPSTLKSDDDDAKYDIKKDTKAPKVSRDSSTSKGRRGRRDQYTPTRQVKRTKRSSGGGLTGSQKEKKEDVRTYSRFLPLEDVKHRDTRCMEEYDMSNICVPMHTHEAVEFPSCTGSRTIPSVFQRNNRIDPACIPQCDNYGIQTDDPRYHCEIDTPAETFTTLPATTATTDSDICPACRKEQVKLPQADIFQYYNVYKDKEGRVYCNICAPLSSTKIPIMTDRSEDILQECSICGNFPHIIDARSVGVTYKYEERSSYCIKCGQLQS